MPQPDRIEPTPASPLAVLELGITHFHGLAANIAHLSAVPNDIEGAEVAIARYHRDLGDAGHEFMLLAEVMSDALTLIRSQQQSQRKARRRLMVCGAIVLFAIGLVVGASYGIREGRERERLDRAFPRLSTTPRETVRH